jgi:hypothetical protein
MKKKLIFIILAMVLVAAALLTSYLTDKSQSGTSDVPQSQTENQKESEGKSITRTGTFGCLVPSGDGPHTMECALGLILEDGTQYGLTAEDQSTLGQIPTNRTVKVTGTFSKQSDQSSKYKTAGTIIVTSVEVL